MRDTATRTIDGLQYSCTMMPAMRSLGVLRRLMAILGTTLARGLAGALGRIGDVDWSDWPAVMAAIKRSGVRWPDLLESVANTLFANLEHSDVEAVVRDLMDGMMVNRLAESGDGGRLTPDVLDDHFRGRVLHMIRVAQFSIEANYADFFDALNSLGGGSEGKAEATKGSGPSTSRGRSTSRARVPREVST